MGLAELLECDASLRSTKEGLHVRFGQAEDSSAVTLGVFIPGLVQCDDFEEDRGGRTLRV